jgi:hypothetical protein
MGAMLDSKLPPSWLVWCFLVADGRSAGGSVTTQCPLPTPSTGFARNGDGDNAGQAPSRPPGWFGGSWWRMAALSLPLLWLDLRIMMIGTMLDKLPPPLLSRHQFVTTHAFFGLWPFSRWGVGLLGLLPSLWSRLPQWQLGFFLVSGGAPLPRNYVGTDVQDALFI